MCTSIVARLILSISIIQSKLLAFFLVLLFSLGVRMYCFFGRGSLYGNRIGFRSLQLHLETRFAQLEAAAKLDLWQEAFRTIEDIHGLMGMSKKAMSTNHAPLLKLNFNVNLIHFHVGLKFIFNIKMCSCPSHK